MELSGDGVAPDSSGQSVAQKLEESRRDVLDLTLRNSLLNFRPSRRLGVRVVDELSREVFRILVRNGRVMYFLPAPEQTVQPNGGDEDNEIPSELLSLLAEPEVESQEPAPRHVDNKLQTLLDKAALNRRLLGTFRHARSSIEEQGVNTLYLALGMLRWYESEDSELERSAPLILVPVRLDRTDVRHSFKLAWTEDEIEANLSLEAKLLNDFRVRLPEMPSEDDLDVGEYLGQAAKAVSRFKRWSVDDDAIHLGFFSFSKFLIYKDLDPTQWPEEQQPADHPVLRALYDPQGFGGESPAIGEDQRIDDHPGAANLHQVVDADSSQTLAVIDAMDGRNLVIQGPPGTGKSQTITNLVAEALARGKRILFVAEKLAALEVVKRRLDTIHLGDACLELHSHNTNKRAVLDEMNRTLGLGKPTSRAGVHDEVLKRRRQQLNEYAVAVNSAVANSELTPHQLVWMLERLASRRIAVDGLGLRCRHSVSWSKGDLERHRALTEDLQSLVLRIGRPRDHLFWSAGLLDFPLPADEQRINTALVRASRELRELRDGLSQLRSLLLPGTDTRDEGPSDGERSLHMADKVIEASGLTAADHRSDYWVTRAPAVADLSQAALRYVDLRVLYQPVLLPEAWDADVLEIRQALVDYGERWWRFLSGVWRRAKARLHGLCRTDPPNEASDSLKLVEGIMEVQQLRQVFADSHDLVAALFPGLTLGAAPEPYREFARAVEWFVALHAEKGAGDVDESIHDMLDQRPAATHVQDVLQTCRAARERLGQALDAVAKAIELLPDRLPVNTGLRDLAYEDLDRWLAAAATQLPSIHDIVRFNQFEGRATEEGIPEVAKAAASRPDAGEHLVDLFEYGCYSTWLEKALKERLALAQFDGTTHERVAKQFRKLDEAQFESTRVHLAQLHWERLPRHHAGGQLGVLRREFQKKKRHFPVRKLMSKAGNAIQSIKPVFMMSPLSIAKYIPPGSVSFDLVVFDEASQVRPVEAMGALLRGKQTVVVGDSKQLPPTSFFDRAGDDVAEEQSETADLESILGLFCAQGAPERWLRWHYRSRHESLITVSNHEFYENRLIVFPSPDAGKIESGLCFQLDPENPYERGGVNVGEAKKVADAIIEHARTTPEITLGAVAFNLKQARRIEDELEILRRRNPSIEASFFARHPEEPFFVKNLENVQGDERDVILISVGYGRLSGGSLPMNFGPLNQDGGERRLNVLITRARRRCVVYSNFAAADLDLRRAKARGIKALKTFLDYADTGVLDMPEESGRAADSPFEEGVAAALRAGGHEIEHQVGSAGFFIDLAVVDPDFPGRYVLGIECDGAMYHSAQSARDRDRLRQQILEDKGWSIHRVWSTDWFRNRERELTRIEDAIRNARSGNGHGPTGAARRKPEPLRRSSATVREAENRSSPYVVAKLRITGLETPLHEVAPAILAEWINEVVRVESPIHLQEAITRVRTAAGVRRTGSRIQQRMEQAIRHGVRSGMFERRSNFLWCPGHRTPDVRSRDGKLPGTAQALKRIDVIAPEEIGQALYHAVKDSFGISEDDAIKQACGLFGFERTGSTITDRIRGVVHQLLSAGILERNGVLLRVPDEAGRS